MTILENLISNVLTNDAQLAADLTNALKGDQTSQFVFALLDSGKPAFCSGAALVNCRIDNGDVQLTSARAIRGRLMAGKRPGKADFDFCDSFEDRNECESCPDQIGCGYFQEQQEREKTSTVIAPADATYFTPGQQISVSYDDDERPEGGVRPGWIFKLAKPEIELALHLNRTGDGVRIDEDVFELPILFYNCGEKRVKVANFSGKNDDDSHVSTINPGTGLVLAASDPKRRERATKMAEIMKLPILDAAAKIAAKQKLLLALGCPAADAKNLANFFWLHPEFSVDDYDPLDHDQWLERAKV